MNYSKEQIARIAILVTTLLAMFGTEIAMEDMSVTILTVINIINGIGYVIRYSKGNVSLLGARK